MKVRRALLLAISLSALPFMQPAARSADSPLPAAPAAAVTSEDAAREFNYKKDILPFLTEYCFTCHGNGKAKADLSFDKFTDDLSVYNDRKTWDGVQHMLETREMPPEKKPQPKQDDVDKTLAAIGGLFEKFDRTAKPNAGRVTIRRLNKTEYNNTVRDLLGVDFKPAADFPADDVGYGFDNIGDVLSVTPLLLEKYLAAAEQILEQAVVIVDAPKPTRSSIGAIRTNAVSTKFEMGGTISFDEGDYFIRCKVGADQVGDENARAMVRVAGADVKEFEVKAPKARPETLEVKVHMKPGTSRVGVAFLNPFALPAPETQPSTQPNAPAGVAATAPSGNAQVAVVPPAGGQPATGQPLGRQGAGQPVAGQPVAGQPQFQRGPPIPVSDGRTRILFLTGIEVDGPYDAPPPALPPVQKLMMAHAPGLAPREAAREIMTRFTTRAYRRPAKPEEVEQTLALYDKLAKQGKRFELCVRAAMFRVLVSPNFLFRVELDPHAAEPGSSYSINEFELASRLSYFLWNSMPDQELFDLAQKGQLRANLDAQVTRMLKDAKSASFTQGFAEQWLTLRKLELSSPDPKMFPAFDNNLRESMIRESDLFFEAIVRENHSILDLLDANFTFVNESLARLYGISGVKGKQFVRVKLPENRGGILTQASVLTLSSNATRTSPVKRGKFVLEQILNTPPPPPPPDVPALEEQKQLTGTLRQVLEQHRANEVCASCHSRMDPLGFAFENFDPIGAWRDKDGAAAIDASGVLPDGRAFNGADGLKQILRTKKELFVRCVAEKMLTYATGRGLEYYDRRAVNSIMLALKKDDYKFSTLLTEIVKSDPFQMRTATGETP